MAHYITRVDITDNALAATRFELLETRSLLAIAINRIDKLETKIPSMTPRNSISRWTTSSRKVRHQAPKPSTSLRGLLPPVVVSQSWDRHHHKELDLDCQVPLVQMHCSTRL